MKALLTILVTVFLTSLTAQADIFDDFKRIELLPQALNHCSSCHKNVVKAKKVYTELSDYSGKVDYTQYLDQRYMPDMNSIRYFFASDKAAAEYYANELKNIGITVSVERLDMTNNSQHKFYNKIELWIVE